MSASQCIKCERIVGGYEKYCHECVAKYGVKQDENFFRTHHFNDWNVDRKAEFENDIAMISTFHVSANVQPETVKALREMMVQVAENAAEHSLEPTVSKRASKPRRRHHKNNKGLPPAGKAN